MFYFGFGLTRHKAEAEAVVVVIVAVALDRIYVLFFEASPDAAGENGREESGDHVRANEEGENKVVDLDLVKYDP